MSQFDFGTMDPDLVSGTELATTLGSWRTAINSCHSGTSQPSYSIAGMLWLDTTTTTAWLLKIYDGTDWITLASINTTTNVVTLVSPTVTNATLTGLTSYAISGLIHGLALSNNSGDTTNDIDIAIGSAASIDTVPVLMSLTGAITKRLDAAWAVGSGNGGLDTGAIANTTYHLWLIRRPDTGVVDVLFSTSATAPTMPTNYTQKRRIGSIMRVAAAIVLFRQIGDIFKRIQVTDRSSTAAAASALLALSVPTGIVVRPIMRYELIGAATITCLVNLGDVGNGAADMTVAALFAGAGDTSDVAYLTIPAIFITNTSAQLYFSQTNTVGTPSGSILYTHGWIDTRGREA